MTCSGLVTNESCTFTCSDGYQISGSHKRTCLNSSQWNGQQTYCYGMNLIGAEKNVYEGHIELEVEYILSKECFVIPHAEYQGYLFLYWITFVII